MEESKASGCTQCNSVDTSDILQETIVENTGIDLIVSDKRKFKWRGDFLKLQLLFDEVSNVKSKWRTAGGAKTLKTEALTIPWYNQSKNLTISGPDAKLK